MNATATAAAAVAALEAVVGPVEVVGTGALAEAVQRLLADRYQPPASEARPAAVVETSGTRTAVDAALARLDHLGTLVLAGPEPADAWPMDLYSDVHVRGLVVLGVPHTDD